MASRRGSRRVSKANSRTNSRTTSKKISRRRSKTNSKKKSKINSQRRSNKNSRKMSKKVSRKKSSRKPSKKMSRSSMKRVAKKNYRGRVGVHNLCVPAADRMMDSKSRMFRPHLFLTEIHATDFSIINEIKRDARGFVMHWLNQDKTGRFMGKYSRTRQGRGRTKGMLLVEGGVEIFNKKLHAHLKDKYGDLIGDYRPAHVRLGSVSMNKIKLYPAFEMEEISTKCD